MLSDEQLTNVMALAAKTITKELHRLEPEASPAEKVELLRKVIQGLYNHFQNVYTVWGHFNDEE